MRMDNTIILIEPTGQCPQGSSIWGVYVSEPLWGGIGHYIKELEIRTKE